MRSVSLVLLLASCSSPHPPAADPPHPLPPLPGTDGVTIYRVDAPLDWLDDSSKLLNDEGRHAGCSGWLGEQALNIVMRAIARRHFPVSAREEFALVEGRPLRITSGPWDLSLVVETGETEERLAVRYDIPTVGRAELTLPVGGTLVFPRHREMLLVSLGRVMTVERRRSPWAQWVPGSFVALETTPKSGRKWVTTETLVSVAFGTCVIRRDAALIEQPYDGSLTVLAPDSDQLRDEVFTVGPTHFCGKPRRATRRIDGCVLEVTEWRTPGIELPLKLTHEVRRDLADGLLRLTWEAVALDVPVEAAGSCFACTQYHVTTESGETWTEWSSENVPGFLVRRERDGVVTVLVAYRARR